MQLQPVVGLNDSPRVIVGSLGDIAQRLHTELQLAGYSVFVEDVESAVLEEARLYASWATFEVQRVAIASITLDLTLEIDAYEWSCIEPVVRAHIEMIEARRGEASVSLGAQTYGMQYAEAQRVYQEQRDLLPKTAFITPPYSIDLS